MIEGEKQPKLVVLINVMFSEKKVRGKVVDWWLVVSGVACFGGDGERSHGAT